ncbi:MAG: 30S ribosomal protein S7 [Candidatus Nealsonbacteria bacterium RIFOXYB1_FULL_40_15]|uniref:Small ribosomal subunit protein uS7 n=1 Tax=Candidatus Nealsonbacteria bacterium RIFOXYB1_FULL_40_15 TaxID=1801677 RepID=A0A1G2EPV0_9BACT|nr:MAG: 30S ribosomal protein S7 [Candidatus Nealsonbacteria bacterium RIFOXYB1_FULL_40_15]OGZ28922.1 MAG: 30S ribosomal protein S7 [Candidatus Nealsonbacteria bacterium RIFOXYD1_FULL_39_11]
MPRGKIQRRVLEPDPVYNSAVVSKLINYVMEEGKKTIARKIVYGAFEHVKKETGKDPIEVFELALRNASPQIEVKSKRVGGATYQVPVEVKGERKLALAFRWIITGARSKKGKPMAIKLAGELMEAANDTGWAVKKKQDTHRMAEANRAFAHFAW